MARLLFVLHDPHSTTGTTYEWSKSREIEHRMVLASDLRSEMETMDFEGVIIFGGDMEASQTIRYPWLNDEKRFIEKALSQGKKIFGLCLGAQLLAEQLGAKLTHLEKWEVGWLPVDLIDPDIGSFSTLTPLHWHSSVFDLPPGAECLARNEFWPHQGFRLPPSGPKRARFSAPSCSSVAPDVHSSVAPVARSSVAPVARSSVVGFQFHAEIDQRRLEHALKSYQNSFKGHVQKAEVIWTEAAEKMEKLKPWYFQQPDSWWGAPQDGVADEE